MSNDYNFESLRNSEAPDEWQQKSDELKAEIEVSFELSTGQTFKRSFRIGQTIEFLKATIEEELDVPAGSQTMFLGDTLLIDPLSLTDYNVPDGATIKVNVE